LPLDLELSSLNLSHVAFEPNGTWEKEEKNGRVRIFRFGITRNNYIYNYALLNLTQSTYDKDNNKQEWRQMCSQCMLSIQSSSIGKRSLETWTIFAI